MSLRITVDLLPGGDPQRAENIAQLNIWREHPEQWEISRYAYLLRTKGDTRSGNGVQHVRSRDVWALVQGVLADDRERRSIRASNPTLFDPPLRDPAEPAAAVAKGAPETSANAALRVFPRTGTQRQRILQFLAEYGPSTDDVIQAVLTMGANTERPRRRELVLGGWVEDSGETQETPTGSQAIVWRLTDRAKAELPHAAR